MTRYLRYMIPLGIFLLLVVFLYRGLSLDPKHIPSPLVGKPMPVFELPRLQQPGTTISNKDLLGKVSIVNIWASWCGSCRVEHEVLLQLAESGKADIYGLNYKDDRLKAMRWLTQLGNPYIANAFDADGRTGINWGVYGAPETFVIDSEGIIRYKQVGPLTVEILNTKIYPLLDKLRPST